MKKTMLTALALALLSAFSLFSCGQERPAPDASVTSQIEAAASASTSVTAVPASAAPAATAPASAAPDTTAPVPQTQPAAPETAVTADLPFPLLGEGETGTLPYTREFVENKLEELSAEGYSFTFRSYVYDENEPTAAERLSERRGDVYHYEMNECHGYYDMSDSESCCCYDWWEGDVNGWMREVIPYTVDFTFADARQIIGTPQMLMLDMLSSYVFCEDAEVVSLGSETLCGVACTAYRTVSFAGYGDDASYVFHIEDATGFCLRQDVTRGESGDAMGAFTCTDYRLGVDVVTPTEYGEITHD